MQQFDLCSGVGAGFPLAGLQLGLNLVGLCERDGYCRDILQERYPDTPIHEDVRSIPNLQGIDIITASPPCPPFSVQGKRRGAADERDCFPEILKAIAQYRPRFFAIENVVGLLSCPYQPGYPKGSYFQLVRGAVRELGYHLEVAKVGSGQVGAPFRRERLLLVGFSQRSERVPRQASPWSEQIRSAVEEVGRAGANRGVKSPVSRTGLCSAVGLDEPLGIPSGCGIARNRRKALGNALDPRVAAIALQRILYLETQA